MKVRVDVLTQSTTRSSYSNAPQPNVISLNLHREAEENDVTLFEVKRKEKEDMMMIALGIHQAYDRCTREEIDEISVGDALKGSFKRLF